MKRVTADDLTSEAQVEKTCTAWLALDGWVGLVTDPKQLRGLGVSEPGIPDRQYRRAGGPLPEKEADTPEQIAAWVQLMWIEWKRVRSEKATKTSVRQDVWHMREGSLGFLTLRAGIDFPATISGFQEWYRASGLMRKRI